jgi:hypothetical protein
MNDRPNKQLYADKMLTSQFFNFSRRILTSRMLTNCRRIQINCLVQWSKEWQMMFNHDLKCKVMHIGKGQFETNYYMDDVMMGSIDKEKDLRVTHLGF